MALKRTILEGSDGKPKLYDNAEGLREENPNARGFGSVDYFFPDETVKFEGFCVVDYADDVDTKNKGQYAALYFEGGRTMSVRQFERPAVNFKEQGEVVAFPEDCVRYAKDLEKGKQYKVMLKYYVGQYRTAVAKAYLKKIG